MTFDVVWFYMLACIPCVVGGIVWVYRREVNWQEWLINSLICFVLAGGFHFLAVSNATRDVETWSGQLVAAKHYTAWEEYYEYAVYRTEYYEEEESYTDSNGRSQTRTVTHSRQVFDHWEPTSRWHQEYWRTQSNIDTSYGIDSAKFEYLCVKFKDKRAVPGDRTTGEHHSRMIGGNPDDYESANRSGWIEPVTKLVQFKNKIKATPSTFSFSKVPDGMKGVFGYPANDNPFISDRLLGTALATVDLFEFDKMNARLGPAKRVNVIMVGMGAADSMLGEWQKSKWIGGKKNDIVILWGGNNKKPTWVKVFGWTDEETCKRDLETIVLDNGATTQVLPLIEAEIRLHYKLKDWEKAFAHISVPAPAWALWTYFGVMVVSQIGLWWWFMDNEYDKDSNKRPHYSY